MGGKIVLVTDDYRIQEDSHTLRCVDEFFALVS